MESEVQQALTGAGIKAPVHPPRRIVVMSDGKSLEVPQSLTRVVERVAQHYGLTLRQMICKARDQGFVWPRQVACYLLRENTQHAFRMISAAVGRTDHTTAMHAYHAVSARIERDPDMLEQVMQIEAQCFGRAAAKPPVIEPYDVVGLTAARPETPSEPVLS